MNIIRRQPIIKKEIKTGFPVPVLSNQYINWLYKIFFYD
ncbi:hypothetical protein DDI_1932 [Dickeya dianthicola RNS04.9]|nr:hypothetical protein DDI_1932 [Dickeya dianthicola RNS04.9]